MPASRLLTGPVPASDQRTGAPPRPDWVAISRLMAGGGTAGRILPGDDPALGFTAPVPVLLVEPFEPLMAADPETGRTCDLQVELLVRRGFARFPLGAAPPRPLAGWRLRAAPGPQRALRPGTARRRAARRPHPRPGRGWPGRGGCALAVPASPRHGTPAVRLAEQPGLLHLQPGEHRPERLHQVDQLPVGQLVDIGVGQLAHRGTQALGDRRHVAGTHVLTLLPRGPPGQDSTASNDAKAAVVYCGPESAVGAPHRWVGHPVCARTTSPIRSRTQRPRACPSQPTTTRRRGTTSTRRGSPTARSRRRYPATNRSASATTGSPPRRRAGASPWRTSWSGRSRTSRRSRHRAPGTTPTWPMTRSTNRTWTPSSSTSRRYRRPTHRCRSTTHPNPRSTWSAGSWSRTRARTRTRSPTRSPGTPAPPGAARAPRSWRCTRYPSREHVGAYRRGLAHPTSGHADSCGAHRVHHQGTSRTGLRRTLRRLDLRRLGRGDRTHPRRRPRLAGTGYRDPPQGGPVAAVGTGQDGLARVRPTAGADPQGKDVAARRGMRGVHAGPAWRLRHAGGDDRGLHGRAAALGPYEAQRPGPARPQQGVAAPPV